MAILSARVPFLYVGFHQCESTLLKIIEETGIRLDYCCTKNGLKAWTLKSTFSRRFSLSFSPSPNVFQFFFCTLTSLSVTSYDGWEGTISGSTRTPFQETHSSVCSWVSSTRSRSGTTCMRQYTCRESRFQM